MPGELAMEKVILVADDEPAVALSLEEYFRLKGYQVLRAFYGDQALEQIRAKQPALVVLDLHMPQMDGIGVLEVIRKSFPNIRTLVITGRLDRYQKDLDRLRPEKVLLKPVSLEEVTRSVELLLGEGKAAPAGPRKAGATGRVRLLFIEGNAEVYERVLKPYFESSDRAAGYETALAKSPAEAFRLLGEFRPQVVVLDGTRMPVGVNPGRLAADLSAAPNPPAEVILHSLALRDWYEEPPKEELARLESAIQRGIHAP